MRYLFHDITYQDKVIRFIKPLDIDSDGARITTNIAELQVIGRYLEYKEPNTVVIALLGRGIIGCSKEDKTRGPVIQAFQKNCKRLPDASYMWKTAELVID